MTIARQKKSGAFTLIELIAVMVVLSILAVVAIPKFFNYGNRAREAACRGVLGSVRTGISNFYADSSLSGTPAYPTLVQMTTVGTVMQDAIPENPYNNLSTVAQVAWTSAQPISGNYGWNYDPATGKFWANSDTTDVDENSW